MKERLKKAQRNKKLCAVYTNTERTTRFTVGFLLDMDDSYIILKLINSYGLYDGIVCIMYDDIYRVESDTVYLKVLEKLVAYYNLSDVNNHNIHSVKDMISLIKEQRRICEIELCDSSNIDIVGYVDKVSSENIELFSVTDCGENDGITTVDINMISQISFDSYDTKKLEILNKN